MVGIDCILLFYLLEGLVYFWVLIDFLINSILSLLMGLLSICLFFLFQLWLLYLLLFFYLWIAIRLDAFHYLQNLFIGVLLLSIFSASAHQRTRSILVEIQLAPLLCLLLLLVGNIGRGEQYLILLLWNGIAEYRRIASFDRVQMLLYVVIVLVGKGWLAFGIAAHGLK